MRMIGQLTASESGQPLHMVMMHPVAVVLHLRGMAVEWDRHCPFTAKPRLHETQRLLFLAYL
jgi:hypothetical protein